MDLNFFNQKGYVVIKNQIESQHLNKLIISSKNVLKNAINIKWPFVRIYRDYPYFFGKPNLFGVDFPLNKSLSTDLFDLFKNLNIGDYIKKLGNFDNFETELIRLHTNSKFFKYQGAWHRDYESFDSSGYLTSVIYLEDENGFKIVTKDKNQYLKNYGINMNLQSNIDDHFKNLPKNMYDIINVKAGDILFFKPGLLHQGYCKTYRLHYHMRFKSVNEKKEYQNLPFNFLEKYLPNGELSKEIPTCSYSMNFTARIIRFKTFFLYFFPRIKSLIHNIFTKKQKLTIFHSTIWQ